MSSHYSEALQDKTTVEIAVTILILRNSTVVLVLRSFPHELCSAQVEPPVLEGIAIPAHTDTCQSTEVDRTPTWGVQERFSFTA